MTEPRLPKNVRPLSRRRAQGGELYERPPDIQAALEEIAGTSLELELTGEQSD